MRRLGFLFAPKLGCLRQKDGGKDQGTSQKFTLGEGVAQDEPATQCGKYAFQAHDDGCHCRLGVFLSDDLQGVGNAAGKNAHVKQAGDHGREIAPLHLLTAEGNEGGENAADQKLQHGKGNAVYPASVGVHHHDVGGKAQGAAKHQGIPEIKVIKATCKAQKVNAHGGNRTCQPDHGRGSLFEKYGVKDIRDFNSGDLEVLSQFKSI